MLVCESHLDACLRGAMVISLVLLAWHCKELDVVEWRIRPITEAGAGGGGREEWIQSLYQNSVLVLAKCNLKIP